MGAYSSLIFPLFMDLLMSRRLFTRLRRELLKGVKGHVLEIGFGTGLNLPYYSSHVTRLVALDPNPGMKRRYEKRVGGAQIPVEQRVASAERIPFEDESFDSVVSTWTMCSIPDLPAALAEVRRVLRPGGRLHFVEHGLARAHPVLQRWQRRLTPLNRRLADGCHLDRDIRGAIEKAGLRLEAIDEFFASAAPRTHSYFYKGVAVRPQA